MTKLEVNVTGRKFSTVDEKEDFIVKYEVEQTAMNSPSSIVFNYYFEGDVDVVHYTTTNALFNAKIKNLQLHCIFFEDYFFKPMKVKGDESCVYQAIASHMVSFCLDNVWIGRFSLEKKTGIKLQQYLRW